MAIQSINHNYLSKSDFSANKMRRWPIRYSEKQVYFYIIFLATGAVTALTCNLVKVKILIPFV